MGKEPFTKFCGLLITFQEFIKLQTFEFSISDVIPANVQKFHLWFSFRSSHPEVFCKKRLLRNFTKFTGKHLCQSLAFIKVAGWGLQLYWKKRLWHSCFPVNFSKFLRTLFLTEHLRWLLFFFAFFLLVLWRKGWWCFWSFPRTYEVARF